MRDIDRTAKPHSEEWFHELRNISEDRIKDSTTSDNIAKSLACLQVVWLATQVVSRSAHHQAVTLLEVSTMAYVMCALIAYGFWWNRPQNCAIPVIVECPDGAMDKMAPSLYGVIPILFASVVYLRDAVVYLKACMHILVLAYILVRIYMVVEDFFSLRALPSSVFRTVKWSSFVPHI